MNKAKIILPIAAMFMLVGCGPKTKQVKEIWGNTWAYTNTVYVGFEINDRQYIQDNKDKIDWDKTRINIGNSSDKYQAGDQTVDNIFSAEFIRTCSEQKYPNIAKNRNFFANNKIVVSKKEDKTVTVGETKYTDAEEREPNGATTIDFNANQSYLQPSCDNEGIIEQLTVNHQIDDYIYNNKISINVFLKNENGSTEEKRGKGYFEIAALA